MHDKATLISALSGQGSAGTPLGSLSALAWMMDDGCTLGPSRSVSCTFGLHLMVSCAKLLVSPHSPKPCQAQRTALWRIRTFAPSFLSAGSTSRPKRGPRHNRIPRRKSLDVMDSMFTRHEPPHEPQRGGPAAPSFYVDFRWRGSHSYGLSSLSGDGFYRAGWALNIGAVCAQGALMSWLHGFSKHWTKHWTPKMLPGPAPLQPHDPGFGSDPHQISNA